MLLKDYYNILELPPSATTEEIKKAYRRLAQIHHPDKNGNNPYSLALFADIKEAYEVLTTPSLKKQYLEQRWYLQSIGKKSSRESINPVWLLKKSLEIERYVFSLDRYRMNKEKLTSEILAILSTETIDKIQAFNEPEANSAIVTNFLKCTAPLTYKQTEEIANQLHKLARENPLSTIQIAAHLEAKKKEKSNGLIHLISILFITLLICLLMWFASR